MFKRLSAVVFLVAALFGASSAGVAAPIPSGQDAPVRAAWVKQVVAAVGALAAAMAESGNFSEAVKQGKKAVDLAPEKEKAECRARLKLYEETKPFRCTSQPNKR